MTDSMERGTREADLAQNTKRTLANPIGSSPGSAGEAVKL
jgi:hypothetical protein